MMLDATAKPEPFSKLEKKWGKRRHNPIFASIFSTSVRPFCT